MASWTRLITLMAGLAITLIGVLATAGGLLTILSGEWVLGGVLLVPLPFGLLLLNDAVDEQEADWPQLPAMTPRVSARRESGQLSTPERAEGELAVVRTARRPR